MKWYQYILIAVFILYFYSNALVYLPDVGLFPFQPFQTIIIFFVLTLPLLFKQNKINQLLYNPVFIWAWVYMILSVLFFIFGSASPENAFQQIKYNFLMFLTLCIGCILFGTPYTEYVQKLLVVTLILGITLNFYELFNPLTFSKNLGRSAGMYQNPNVSALALLIGLIFCQNTIKNTLMSSFLIGLTGLAVFITFSRAGMLSYGLVLVLMYRFKKFNPLPLVIATIILLGLIFYFDIFGVNDILNTQEIVEITERINFFGNDQSLSDDSSYERSHLLQMGINKYLDSPIWGTGLGGGQEVSGIAYSDQSTHNQFVYVLIEFGILGMVLLVSLLVIIAQSVPKWTNSFEISTFLLLYTFNCLFSHNMFDSYYLLVIVSFIPIFENSFNKP